MTTSTEKRSAAIGFIVCLGVVSLFAGMTVSGFTELLFLVIPVVVVCLLWILLAQPCAAAAENTGLRCRCRTIEYRFEVVLCTPTFVENPQLTYSPQFFRTCPARAGRHRRISKVNEVHDGM